MTELAPPLPWATTAPRRRSARARVAQALCHRVVQDLPVRLRHPDGTEVGGGDADSPVLELVRPVAAFERMAASPKIGIGEAYMAGDWRAADGTDLADLLTPFAEHLPTILPRPLMRLRRLVDRTIPSSQANTPTGSRRNIAAHYDLSNDLFALFLDPTLSYSSALFDDARPWDEQDLAEAQRRKVDAVLDRAGVRGGTRLLEIGTGWGELALRAARRGAHVTTITLSAEQADLARARVAEAGLADRVDIRLEDYRSVEGSHDAVVSVEMIEAVGEEFWPTYFQAIDRLLAPGGRAAVQAILMDHEQLRATRHSYGWIQKYIFPGGLIPSIRAIDEVTRRHTDLRLTGTHAFGPHYAETLRRWRQVFLESWPAVATLGFDETFRRMWEFYLAYSEAGFASGYLDVAQLTLARDGD